MKQVQKITQIQHHLQLSFKISNGDQHQICSSLSNRLIPSLNFRRKLLKNKLDRETDTSMKNFNKKKKSSKNVTIFSSKLNRIFGLENVEIWFRKLEPKYETGAKDNTSSASSLTSFQNSNGDQHQICSSLSKQVYLLPQLQKKANNLTIKLIHPFPI